MAAFLRKSQFLPISVPAAWEFLSNPGNLPAITPPGMGFRILELPFGLAGSLLAGPLVRRRLEAIFAFRAKALRARFGNA